MTRRGYIRRLPMQAHLNQSPGERGLTETATHTGDDILHVFSAQTLDSILFFTSKGQVYQERVYQIPDTGRTANGVLLSSILALDADQPVITALNVPSFEQASYVTMFTRLGRAKRTELSEFAGLRPSGLIAINLDAEDELGWVIVTHGDQDLIIVTEQGQALRFREDTVRPMGCTAAGVYAIKLDAGDYVASASVVDPEGDLLVITSRGYGKRIPLSEFSVKGRYGKGVRCLGGDPKQTGIIVAARVVRPADEITIISSGGMGSHIPVANIPRMGRATRGSKVIDLKQGDEATSVALQSLGTEEKKDES
jgi:DNA gyrase subunit A